MLVLVSSCYSQANNCFISFQKYAYLQIALQQITNFNPYPLPFPAPASPISQKDSGSLKANEYLVISDYPSAGIGEISLQEGTTVTVIEKNERGGCDGVTS